MTQNNPHKLEMMMFMTAVAILGTSLYFLGPSITSFVIKEVSYSKDLNLVVTSNGSYTLELYDTGELKSLKLDGRVTSYGKAKVYIESNGIRYLAFDSSRLDESQINETITNESNLITGFAAKEESDKDKKNSNKKPEWIGVDEFVVNGTVEINLSEYFTDEDGDELAYSVSEAESLDVSVDGAIVTIEPENNLNTTMTFIASDGIDSRSHTVKLIVIAEKIIDDATLPINETNKTINQTPAINEINQTPIGNETINQTQANITNETIDKTIAVNLAYNSGTIYDANDNGEESVNGVVDLSIAGTKFGWDADESRLCTRWEIYNIEEEILTTFCNGNADCCAFFELLPTKTNWSEIYYAAFGKDGAGHDNIISAQVIYYDVNLSADNLKSEIYNSEWSNLSVNFFEEEIEFFDVCLETCDLSGLNRSSYTLVFEIEDDAILRIDNIDYSALIDVKNNPPVLLQNFSTIIVPKNKKTAINLSKYFNDPDGDVLNYNYYESENIKIIFEKDTAIIIPEKNFEGIGFTYIIANDSENSITSNVFRIDVKDIKLDKLEYNFSDGENTVISYYIDAEGEKVKVNFNDYVHEPNKFGYVFNADDIEQELKGKGKSFDKKIYFEIDSSKDYELSSVYPYTLERNLTSQFRNATNQIGQIESRQLKRFIDFSDIFSKESNLYDIQVAEGNITLCADIQGDSCNRYETITINETVKTPRDYSYSFDRRGNAWIVGFFNIFDLDPIFFEDTDSNWNSGTFFRTYVRGTGTDANLTGENQSGHFASQVFDATSASN